ncbi:hypothetical protein [Ligilactobacillus equi]|nr:hypothetical protein [Ligilactobacillus equi]
MKTIDNLFTKNGSFYKLETVTDQESYNMYYEMLEDDGLLITGLTTGKNGFQKIFENKIHNLFENIDKNAQDIKNLIFTFKPLYAAEYYHDDSDIMELLSKYSYNDASETNNPKDKILSDSRNFLIIDCCEADRFSGAFERVLNILHINFAEIKGYYQGEDEFITFADNREISESYRSYIECVCFGGLIELVSVDGDEEEYVQATYTNDDIFLYENKDKVAEKSLKVLEKDGFLPVDKQFVDKFESLVDDLIDTFKKQNSNRVGFNNYLGKSLDSVFFATKALEMLPYLFEYVDLEKVTKNSPKEWMDELANPLCVAKYLEDKAEYGENDSSFKKFLLSKFNVEKKQGEKYGKYTR